MAIATGSLPPDENRALPGLSIYMWVGCGIATAVVAVRLIGRLALKHALEWDDLFIGVSYLAAVALYVGTAGLFAHGYGHHIYYVSSSDRIILLKINTVVYICGFASLALARTSIGLFLLRLVARVATWSWIVYFGLALNAIQAVASVITIGLHCVPIQKLWDPTISGFCIPLKQLTAASRFIGCLSVIVDLTFAVFPILLLRQVQIQRKVRVAIYLLLSCGLLAAVCSIGRAVTSDFTVEDTTWDLVPLTYWALSENSGVLILACLPAMNQLFRHTKSVTRNRSYGKGKKSSKDPSNQGIGPERRINDTDSRTDLIFSRGNSCMQKDFCIELSDRAPIANLHHDISR